MMKMKGAALRYGRDIWTDYVLVSSLFTLEDSEFRSNFFFNKKKLSLLQLLDADVFLTHADTLQLLISQNVSVVAPMLQSDGLYSNYWCGMTERFYYQRTDEYKQILDSEKVGTFPVPMVHSAILIDLNDEASDQLTYDIDSLAEYSGPVDDIIVFAMSANYSGTTLYVSNVDMFGYMMSPLEEGDSLEKDVQQLTNLKVMHINRYSRPMPVVDALSNFVSLPPKDRMTLSKIFMINLWRREERRDKMLMNFDALGLDVQHFPAVDGKQMDEEYLKKMNIQFLPGYEDPYSKRPMTMGEIGCALSHYFIWEKIVEEGLEEVLVLEDDIRFEPYFKQRLEVIMDEVRMDREWDLVYVGRKRLLESSEPWVDGTNYLVRPSYSYWTLGYLISLKGAKKLLAERPLQRLVPVDEYLPIMFDKHTNENWKKEFPNRNLNAFSVAPLLLFPTHYTGDQGYISDTENSEQIPAESGHQPPPQFGNNNSEIVGRIPKNNDKEQVTEDRRDTPAKMNLKENVKHEL